MKFIFIKSQKLALNKVYTTFFVTILLLSFFPQIANAQFGVKIGTTFSNFYYTDKNMDPNLAYEIDLRPYLGYDVEWVQLGNQNAVYSPFIGVYYNYQFSERFSLQPALSYTQKGVSFDQFDYERVIYKLKISYLEIPLSIACKFIKKEKFISEIYLGGFGAFKLKAVKKVAVGDGPTKKIQIGNVNNFDAGIHFGLAFKYRIAEDYILLDLRIFNGFTDIFYMPENQPQLYHSTQKTKITGFNLTLGYEF